MPAITDGTPDAVGSMREGRMAPGARRGSPRTTARGAVGRGCRPIVRDTCPDEGSAGPRADCRGRGAEGRRAGAGGPFSEAASDIIGMIDEARPRLRGRPVPDGDSSDELLSGGTRMEDQERTRAPPTYLIWPRPAKGMS